MPKKASAELVAAVVETYRLEGSTVAAEKHGVHKSSATRWAKAAGVATVATSTTREATEARSVTLRERRQLLSESLMDKVEAIIPRLTGPTVVYSFSPRDNSFAEAEVSQPPAHDVRAIAGAVGTLLTQINKVIDNEPSATTAAAKSMLETAIEQFGIQQFDPDDDPEEGDEDDGIDSYDPANTEDIPLGDSGADTAPIAVTKTARIP